MKELQSLSHNELLECKKKLDVGLKDDIKRKLPIIEAFIENAKKTENEKASLKKKQYDVVDMLMVSLFYGLLNGFNNRWSVFIEEINKQLHSKKPVKKVKSIKKGKKKKSAKKVKSVKKS